MPKSLFQNRIVNNIPEENRISLFEIWLSETLIGLLNQNGQLVEVFKAIFPLLNLSQRILLKCIIEKSLENPNVVISFKSLADLGETRRVIRTCRIIEKKLKSLGVPPMEVLSRRNLKGGITGILLNLNYPSKIVREA